MASIKEWALPIMLPADCAICLCVRALISAQHKVFTSLRLATRSAATQHPSLRIISHHPSVSSAPSLWLLVNTRTCTSHSAPISAAAVCTDHDRPPPPRHSAATGPCVPLVPLVPLVSLMACSSPVGFFFCPKAARGIYISDLTGTGLLMALIF